MLQLTDLPIQLQNILLPKHKQYYSGDCSALALRDLYDLKGNLEK